MSDPSQPSDARHPTGPPDQTVALLRAWHDGAQDALAELVERDRSWIIERVRQRRGPLLQRHGETLDDAHDLIAEVLQYAPRFVVKSRAQFRALVARMIENALIDKARRVGRKAAPRWASHSVLALDPSLVVESSVGAAAAHNEELDWLRLAIEFLDEKDRHIVRRARLEEASYVEIGAEEGVDPNTVRMRCNRAMLRLAGLVQRLQRGELGAVVEDAD